MKRLLAISTFLFIIQLVQAEKVFILPLNGDVNVGMTKLVKKGFIQADSINADYILIELNTYGGGVHDADEIRKLILNETVPVFVFINQNAGSAGALISIACDSIYMAPGAIMGASSVVNQEGEIVPEKYQSFMRSKMRATAEANNRDPEIAEAMVGHNLQKADSTTTVLSLTAQEAVRVNYCEKIIEDKNEIFADFDEVEYIQYTVSNIDSFIYWLLSPSVQSILLLLIFGSIYFAFQAPGTLLPLIVLALSITLYFFPNYIYGFLASWEILLFIVGIILITLEIFVIPGFGIAGISGILAVFTSLFLSMLDNDFFNFDKVNEDALQNAFGVVLIGFVGGMIFILAAGSLFLKSSIFKALSVQETINKKAPTQDIKNYIGKTGVTITKLNPSGLVEIDNKSLDAIVQYGALNPQDQVLVVAVDMNTLIVKKV